MVSNAQNCRHKSLELNPVSTLISDEDLEVNICKTLSLTGYKVKLDDIHACYCLWGSHFKFKCRKQIKILVEGRTFAIIQMVSYNWNSLVNLLLQNECDMRTIILNVGIKKMMERSIGCGFGAILLTLNLMKEINLSKSIILLTLKNCW